MNRKKEKKEKERMLRRPARFFYLGLKGEKNEEGKKETAHRPRPS